MKSSTKTAIALLARAIEALAVGREAAAVEHVRGALAALGGEAKGDSSRPTWAEVEGLVAGALAGERPEALRLVRTAIKIFRGG